MTSYGELYRDGHAARALEHAAPGRDAEVPYVTQCFDGRAGRRSSRRRDYLKALPDVIDRWLPRPLVSLGTDGFGRSESRADLRNHFEVDARFVVVATLPRWRARSQLDAKVVQQAIKDLGINPEKANPAIA